MPTRPRTGQLRSPSQTTTQLNFEDWVEDAGLKLFDLEERLGNIEGIDVANLSSDVIVLQSDVATLDGNGQTNTSDIAELSTLIDNLEVSVIALESLRGFTIQYDLQDRIEALNFIDGSSTQIVYDNDGNIQEVITHKGTKTLNYDVDGNLIGISIS